MSIGEKIKELRKLKGLTQEELANKCGLSKNGLWNYENNKRNPNTEILERIAKVLGVPLYKLIVNEKVNGEEETLKRNQIKQEVVEVTNYFEAVKWAFGQGKSLKCNRDEEMQLIANIIEMLTEEHLSISHAQDILLDSSKIILMINNL
ncbi:helix-turn-helix transcriptional regulator [uncultured Clostridium sp.]|uniref:helix-turn-helix domain-containing protein n=1 Tax=uncultured Clostridium sp. TaxID=59620 RepID=UPI0028EAD31F|nr:helix-turn-helix transcriptional regulator [uncultured Clostridium sp.]